MAAAPISWGEHEFVGWRLAPAKGVFFQSFPVFFFYPKIFRKRHQHLGREIRLI
jgi:hypothetical protein